VSVAYLDRAADLLEGLDVDPMTEKRRQLLAECPTPAHLAARFDPTYVRTEAGDLIAARLIETLTVYDGRLTVSQPPQTGKSLTLRWACVWLLLRDPDTRIVYTSYAMSLARTGSRIIRTLIETHCGAYGLHLDTSHADAADWQLAGHLGGVFAVGTGGGLTGRACSAMIIDDPHPSMAGADSPTQRENVHEWWSSVARTRLAPGAPVVGVATRWHEKDLISSFIDEGWPSVNIPAQADGETLDSLGRKPGAYLTTPRGTTAEDWQKTRKEAGERTWASLYQGRPSPAEGGVFKRAWFDAHRVTPDQVPDGAARTVVVDPADNEGSGDEAGILLVAVAGGKVHVLDDLSAAMTVARWARVAMLTCVRHGAPQIVYEQSLSQLPNRIRDVWRQLHQQATALAEAEGDPARALELLARPVDGPAARELLAEALAELDPDDAAEILRLGTVGPRLKAVTARGTKADRMIWAAPKVETGRLVLAGRFPKLEHQAVTWQVGMDSPDRVDALCHAASLESIPRSRVRFLG